jgi:hypothetical protein
MRNKVLRQVKRSSFAFATFIFCVGFVGQAIAAPKAVLWPHWQTHDANNTHMIDHSAWDRLIKRNIMSGPNGINLFQYRAVTNADKEKLRRYIIALSKKPISQFNRREQLAYWVNIYNALTVQVILRHYPVESIRDINISPGLFTGGPWGKKLVTVEGKKISLDDIEHRILRPIWRDARIHYAVNCASIGCPNLQDKAYTAANAENLLTLGAQQYINSPRGVIIKDGEIIISKIYDWFQTDFGGTEQKVIAHLLKYAKPKLKKHLKMIGEISNFTYDWALNGVPKISQ